MWYGVYSQRDLLSWRDLQMRSSSNNVQQALKCIHAVTVFRKITLIFTKRCQWRLFQEFRQHVLFTWVHQFNCNLKTFRLKWHTLSTCQCILNFPYCYWYIFIVLRQAHIFQNQLTAGCKCPQTTKCWKRITFVWKNKLDY